MTVIARLPRRARASGAVRGLRPTSFRVRDVVGAAVRAIAARPARSVLTASGTVVGMAALVATISLTATAQRQISDAFAALSVDELGVTAFPEEGRSPALEPSALAALRSRPDVRAAGVFQPMEGSVHVQASPHVDGRMVRPYAVDDAVLAAVAPAFSWGGHDFASRAGRVALLADAVASTMGLGEPAAGQTILVNGHTFALGGLIRDVEVHNELLLGLVVSPEDAAEIGLGPIDSLSVFAVAGNTDRLAGAVPHVLSPEDPAAVVVTRKPAPERLRQQVDSSVRQLLLLLAVVALGISGLGIANTTLTAVMERSSEIGLQRALGARRRHVAAQTVAESGLLGLGGALAGVWLGGMVTVVAAMLLRWEPVLDLRPVWIGPAVGLAVGILAGLYPAMRAASLQPADVLRR